MKLAWWKTSQPGGWQKGIVGQAEVLGRIDRAVGSAMFHDVGEVIRKALDLVGGPLFAAHQSL
jgi:hypothetical protein